MHERRLGNSRQLGAAVVAVGLAGIFASAPALAQSEIKDDPSLRLQVFTLRHGNTYVDGELPMLWNVVVHSDDTESRQLTLKAHIVDYWNQQVFAEERECSVPGGKFYWWHFKFAPPSRGFFRIYVEAVAEDKVAEEARTTAAWIPPPHPAPSPADESVFGLYAWAGYDPWGYLTGSLKG
ncbi:unnamed protein product, partial [marine sediment metagenome]